MPLQVRISDSVDLEDLEIKVHLSQGLFPNS